MSLNLPMKKVTQSLLALLFAALPVTGFAAAADVLFSQKNASNTAWANVIVAPTASSALAFNSSKVPISTQALTLSSVTSPASTPLTLGTGTSGAAITVLSASNYVGIGTPTPTSQLTIYGAAGISAGVDDDNRAAFGYSAGRLYFGTRVASVNYFDALNIVSGNVGIGTTTPNKKLEVFKDLATNTLGSGEVLRILGDDGNTVGRVTELGFGVGPTGATFASALIGAVNISATGFGTKDLYFATRSSTVDVAPTERMRIAATGTVSIASTTASSSAITGALQVAGGIGAGAASVFTNSLIVSGTSPVVLRSTGTTDVSVSAISTDADSSAFLYVQNDARQWTMRVNGLDSDKFNIRDSTAGADRLTIDSAGAATFSGAVTAGAAAFDRLGLNSNPINTVSTAQSFARFQSTGADFYTGTESNTPGGFFPSSTAYAAVLYNSAATPMHFYTSGVLRATISAAGAATFAGDVTVSGTLTNTAAQLGTFTSTTANGTSGEGNFTVVSSNTNTDIAYGINRAPGIAIRNTSGTANSYGGISFQDGGSNATSSIFGIFENDANNTGSLQFATRPSGGSLTTALTLASTGAATFAGDVTVNGTQTNLGGAVFTTTNNVNIRGTNAGIAIYNSVAGSSNNWSTIRNTATGSDSNLIFSTNTVPALTLDGSANATFAGAVTASKFASDASSSFSALTATGVRLEANASWGGVLSGYGTTNDVSIFNKSGALVLSVPTGTIAATFAGAVGAPSLTSPAATNLTLGTTSFGTALTVVSSNGQVGIGTTTPSDRFVVSNAGAAGIEFGVTTSVLNQAYNRSTSSYVDYQDSCLNRIFATNGTTEAMRIASTGAVRFNAYGAGAATFDSSGNITSVSDARLKNITGTFTKGLAEIVKLTPKLYTWKPETGLVTDDINATLIAQDLIAAGLTEAVSTYRTVPVMENDVQSAEDIAAGKPVTQHAKLDADGKPVTKRVDSNYSVSDRTVIAALVNAVKELKAEIDALKAAK